MTDFLMIPLNGLPAGKSVFTWHAGKEFFEDFDNSEVLDADLAVCAEVEKSGSYLGTDIRIDGTLTVPCDRCMEPLEMPVDEIVRLSFKFGDEPAGGEADPAEGERETVWLPTDGGDIDLSQIVYDYACLALPMQRVHAEGECNPDAYRWLEKGETELTEPAQTPADSPFAALKGLFDNKE